MSVENSRSTALATFGLISVTAIWGSTFFLIKDLVARMPVADFLAVRFVIAAVPATGAGWLTFQLLGGVGGWPASDRLPGFLAAAVIGAVTLLVYVGFLALLRAPELQTAVRTVRRLLGR